MKTVGGGVCCLVYTCYEMSTANTWSLERNLHYQKFTNYSVIVLSTVNLFLPKIRQLKKKRIVMQIINFSSYKMKTFFYTFCGAPGKVVCLTRSPGSFYRKRIHFPP